MGSIPGSGSSPGEENGNPLRYSCRDNPMDRGTWWATVHRVTKSWTRLSVHTTTQLPSRSKKEEVNHLKLRKHVSKSNKITFRKKSRIKTSESTLTTLLYVRKSCWYCFPKYIQSLAISNQLHCCHSGPNHHPLTKMAAMIFSLAWLLHLCPVHATPRMAAGGIPSTPQYHPAPFSSQNSPNRSHLKSKRQSSA